MTNFRPGTEEWDQHQRNKKAFAKTLEDASTEYADQLEKQASTYSLPIGIDKDERFGTYEMSMHTDRGNVKHKFTEAELRALKKKLIGFRFD